MLRTILIDDEQDCVNLLARELTLHCPQIEIIGQTTSSPEGLRLIQQQQPDLVFLDIEMPRLNGFQLLEKVGELFFQLVFVTAYNEYAVKAFRYSALDYLLKPIDVEELKAAVSKATRQQRIDGRQVAMLQRQLQERQLADKIAVPYQNGIVFLALKDILYCEADNNYTRVIATQNRHFLLTRTLREVQHFLEERNFMRVHRQFLINLDQIKMFMKGEGQYLIMNNEVSIPVARQQKEKLIQRFGWL